MPVVRAGSVSLSYEIHGAGEPVLMIPPAGTRAAIWLEHQVPALAGAGYLAVIFDSRGTAPSSVPPGPYCLADLVTDACALITELGLIRCHLIGASLGAMVAQELALARPDLVRSAILLGTRCRTGFFHRLSAEAIAARIRDCAVTSDFEAVAHLSRLFGSVTLDDDRRAADWFALFRRFPLRGAGPAAEYEATVFGDRTPALRGVIRPCAVVAFGGDSVTSPALCREVAVAIPGCRYVEVPGTGHFGFLEAPVEVNRVILDFLASVG